MRIKLLIFISIFFAFNVNLYSFSGEKCLKCHSKDKILNGSYIHSPVKKKDCIVCHRAHASKFDNLLNLPLEKLCKKCHEQLFKKSKQAKFIHPPFEKKACTRCHKAHSSNIKSLLKSPPKKLCINCHKALKTKYKFEHAPFKQGKCLNCHTDHFSNDMRFIKANGSKLCLKCHKINNTLQKKHRENLSKFECLTCHNPHGSKNRALLRKVAHKPFSDNNCKYCHTKNLNNKKLCLNCHKNIMKGFNKVHNHLLGGIDKNPCLICHNPHVGDTKALLKDAPERLCQRCHFETYRQKINSLYIHPDWNKCTNCHEGHGENNIAMLKEGATKSCAKCHESHAKFTHPIGEKVKDPRNGQTLTCVTCHDPMGTNYKYNLRLSGEGELCLECHKNY